MGSRGPIAQPDNVRELRGNPGRRQSPKTPKAVPGTPEVPSWLSAEGKAEWKRITPELKRLGILSRIDRGILTMCCDTWAKWVEAAKEIQEQGLVIKGHRNMDRKHPAFVLYRECAGLYASMAKELGISPNARLRMTLPEAESEDDSDLD